MSDRQFFLLAVLVYGVSTIYSVFLWRKGFRRDDRVIYAFLALATVLHVTAMTNRGLSLARCPVGNIYEATVFLGWTMVTACLVLGLMPRFRHVGAFASPLFFALGVFALMPGLDTQGPLAPLAETASLHAALVMLSYGAFGLSSVAALMYLAQERDLKVHRIRALLALLPSMERLETVMSRLMTTGFVLLTLGLISGGYYLHRTQGVIFSSDFKVLWSVLVWGLYLTLVVAHWQFSQVGHRFAWGALGSFVFVLLTFWGANLVSPIHNP